MGPENLIGNPALDYLLPERSERYPVAAGLAAILLKNKENIFLKGVTSVRQTCLVAFEATGYSAADRLGRSAEGAGRSVGVRTKIFEVECIHKVRANAQCFLASFRRKNRREGHRSSCQADVTQRSHGASFPQLPFSVYLGHLRRAM